MPSKISQNNNSTTAATGNKGFVAEPERTRLHITPFNSALLGAIIPASVLPTASNISFHSLETFPEKEFGFVELPTMEAKKIKKKLSGAILRGTKVQIEEARPEKRAIVVEEEVEEAQQTEKQKRRKTKEESRKRKRDDETLSGVELEDRKVKRGWTEPVSSKKTKGTKDSKGKKEAVKSKYTTGPECLFKTTVPPNKAVEEGKAKKEKRKGKKADRDVVVHEFAKTTKHATFLRSSSTSSGKKGVSEYVDGKGWVDEDGNVVEPVVVKKKPTKSVVTREVEEDSEESSEEDSSDADSDASIEAKKAKLTPPRVVKPPPKEESDTSSSGTSSEDEEDSDSDFTSSSGSSSESEAEADSEDEAESQTSTPKAPSTTTATPKAKPPDLSIQIPNASTTSTSTSTSTIPPSTSNPPPKPAIHPLEALYKRRRPDLKTPMVAPAPAPLPAFSFFGNDNDDVDVDNDNDGGADGASTHFAIPMTPFTEQDLAARHIRSAAPTPDTAFPFGRGKMDMSWPGGGGDYGFPDYGDAGGEEDGDGDGEDTPTARRYAHAHTSLNSIDEDGEDTGKGKGKAKEDMGTRAKEEDEEIETEATPFTKWFYTHRGAANRAWKKRRRDAAKEKRWRENKRRGGGDRHGVEKE